MQLNIALIWFCGLCMARFSDRHTFGSVLEHLSVLQKRKEYRTEVCVAADFPDSKPDASSCLGDLGYHPLEEISNFERKKNIEHTDQILTDAEIARTLTEVYIAIQLCDYDAKIFKARIYPNFCRCSFLCL